MLPSVLRRFVLEPSLSECWATGEAWAARCAYEFAESALGGCSGNGDGRRCELREFVRGSLDFELVMSYFVDEDLEGVSGLETSRLKFLAGRSLLSAWRGDRRTQRIETHFELEKG